LATLIVVGLDRIARMVAPLALIVVLAVEAWTYRDDAAAFVPTMPAGLNHSAAGSLLQQVSLGIAVVAAVLALGGLLLGLFAQPSDSPATAKFG
jgi:predicted RND superfamily exporter protein